MPDDILVEKLEFDASQALKAMKDVQEQAETTAGKAELLAKQVADYSRSLGQDWKETLASMKAAGDEAGLKFKTPLGLDITEDVYKNTAATLENAEAKNRYVTADKAAAASTREFSGEVKNTTGQIGLFGHSIDVIRTALGTLVAVGIFTALQAITSFFRDATDQARQFEETLYRISNAERQLSKEGLDVSVKGLKKGIDDIQSALPIFSKEDVAQLVGGVATTTKELGLTEEQILKLSAAISILNVNSTETEGLLATQAKVTNALISPQARSVGNLGLAFGKLKMEAEGAKLGINKTLSEMSDAEKTKIKLQIVFETAGLNNVNDISKLRDEIKKSGGDFAALNDYLNSNTGRLAANGAAWKDLETTVGQVFLPLLPGLTKFFSFMTDGFNGLKFLIIEASAGFMGLADAIKAVWNAPLGADLGAKFAEGMTKGITETRKNLVNTFFPSGDLGNASQYIKDLYQPLINPPRETPTVAKTYEDEMSKAEEAVQKSEDKITQIMSEAADKRAQIETDYQRKIEDANRDYSQKLDDIARDVERKKEDAALNLSQKLQDIDRDFNEREAQAKQESQQKDIDREKAYQERLRELREKFADDLEDALRDRDARKVLKLIRDYNRDKKNLDEKHKLEQNQAKKDLQQKLADLEHERQLKIDAAIREYQEKLADIKIWQERERADAQLALQRKLQDANLWHQRELKEYQQYLQRKLEDLAKSIVKEYQLTAAGAAAIYSLLQGYYGANGSISNLLANGLTQSLNGILSNSSSGVSGGGSTVDPSWAKNGYYGAAEGGSFIATRPTPVVFGEKGPEMATFTPLGQSSSVKSFSSPDTTGSNGTITLKVSMSPDLIAEVTDTTLDSVALHLEHLSRSK